MRPRTAVRPLLVAGALLVAGGCAQEAQVTRSHMNHPAGGFGSYLEPAEGNRLGEPRPTTAGGTSTGEPRHVDAGDETDGDAETDDG